MIAHLGEGAMEELKGLKITTETKKAVEQLIGAPTQVRYDWSKVDWSKTTSQIAEETGAHPYHVSRVRRKRAPETLHIYDRGKERDDE